MRNMMILAGIIAVIAMIVPGFLQSHPQVVNSLFGRSAKERTVAPAPLVASAEPENPQPLLGRKMRLEAGPGGHFTGDFRLNGYDVPAMIDTGATFVALNRSTAERIGIRLSHSDYRYAVNTANGRTKAAGTIIDSIDIGRIHLDNVQALVLDDDALSGTLVGMSFLKRLSKYEVDGGELLLEQ
ncbi:MAG: TIGR02281 family clan AA aspartic protease [Rhizobiaceae bacterium]|nr:MAG: TIGR02281 family clan AA aspartic protease [Rhizobiaceae bacterium]